MRSRRGGVTIEREVRCVGPGLVGLRQRFSGDGERVVVTHQGSLVARVEVLKGRVWFFEREAPRCFVLSVPPRSLVRMRFEGAVAESDGLGRIGALSRGPAQVRESDDLIASDTLFLLDADEGVPAEVVHARSALHQHLSSPAPLRAAAREVGLQPQTLTRAFARAYGLTPKRYCTRARLFDAAIGLFTGAPIVSAALASGFNDVSRFYAQFKQVLRATPGEYVRAWRGNRQDPR
jgi:AraC-like DNA-binding protein